MIVCTQKESETLDSISSEVSVQLVKIKPNNISDTLNFCCTSAFLKYIYIYIYNSDALGHLSFKTSRSE